MGCVFRFFLLVTFFSVSEVAILLWVTAHTGLLFTIACCVFTGVLGGYLVREQGLQTFSRIQATMKDGQIPADEAVEALMLFVVGILLCVPGFITDTLGFLIIIPSVRKLVASMVTHQIKNMIASGHIHVFNSDGRQTHENYRNTAKKADTNEIENAEIIDEFKPMGENDAKKKQI